MHSTHRDEFEMRDEISSSLLLLDKKAKNKFLPKLLTVALIGNQLFDIITGQTCIQLSEAEWASSVFARNKT